MSQTHFPIVDCLPTNVFDHARTLFNKLRLYSISQLLLHDDAAAAHPTVPPWDEFVTHFQSAHLSSDAPWWWNVLRDAVHAVQHQVVNSPCVQKRASDAYATMVQTAHFQTMPSDGDVSLYCDASYASDTTTGVRTGGAIVFQTQQSLACVAHLRVGGHSNSYMGEAITLATALRCGSVLSDLTIHTDCLSIIKRVLSSEKRLPTLNQLMRLEGGDVIHDILMSMQARTAVGSTTLIKHVKGHSGVPGNVLADKEARVAAQQMPAHSISDNVVIAPFQCVAFHQDYGRIQTDMRRFIRRLGVQQALQQRAQLREQGVGFRALSLQVSMPSIPVGTTDADDTLTVNLSVYPLVPKWARINTSREWRALGRASFLLSYSQLLSAKWLYQCKQRTSPACPDCGALEQTTQHLCCDCPATADLRQGRQQQVQSIMAPLSHNTWFVSLCSDVQRILSCPVPVCALPVPCAIALLPPADRREANTAMASILQAQRQFAVLLWNRVAKRVRFLRTAPPQAVQPARTVVSVHAI